ALGSRSFLVAISNPKALLFMSAFLPQFIDPARAAFSRNTPRWPPSWPPLNVAVMTAYAALGARLVRRARRRAAVAEPPVRRRHDRLAATLALYRRNAP
ncbi:hypothetical protein AD428_10920, partial [Achromobacter sp. DMS1]